jgi:hypothetical protein
MASNEIDLHKLRTALNAIIDHPVEDLGITTVKIEEKEDFYWYYDSRDTYNMSKTPVEPLTGQLTDDNDFVKLVHRGESADISLNLIHVAPLLKYIGEKIKS